MNKTSAKSKHKKTGKIKHQDHAARDRAVYLSLIMIGIFLVLLAIPLTQGAYWRHVLVLYLAFLIFTMNMFAWRAYRGGRLVLWQASLAKLPLHWAGYGVKGGKPIEAAHDKIEARNAVVISTVCGLILLVVVIVLLIPNLLNGR